MSERIIFPEQKQAPEALSEQVEQAERLIVSAENAPEVLSAEDIKRLEAEVLDKAKSKDEVKPQTQEQAPAVTGSLHEHKKAAYKQGVRHIQSKLKPRERRLSKVIHQPVVDKLSAVTGKTIARPSGMLGGGIFALIGSCALLYASRKYGFEYNYFVYILLLLVGYMVGSFVEILVKIFRRDHLA